MEKVERFEDLWIRKQSRELVKEVYMDSYVTKQRRTKTWQIAAGIVSLTKYLKNRIKRVKLKIQSNQ